MDEIMEGCRKVIIVDDLEHTITIQIWADSWDGEGSTLLGKVTKPYNSHHTDYPGCEWKGELNGKTEKT